MSYGRTTKGVDARLGSIHLQGVGRVAAIPATELRKGMILSWNYAPAEYVVLSVRRISARYLELTEASRITGEVFRRKLRDDRLIAARPPTERERARDAARKRERHISRDSVASCTCAHASKRDRTRRPRRARKARRR